MSQLLNCGVDQRTLTLLVALIENGVNPEALANVVKELQRETRALKVILFLREKFKQIEEELLQQQNMRPGGNSGPLGGNNNRGSGGLGHR